MTFLEQISAPGQSRGPFCARRGAERAMRSTEPAVVASWRAGQAGRVLVSPTLFGKGFDRGNPRNRDAQRTSHCAFEPFAIWVAPLAERVSISLTAGTLPRESRAVRCPLHASYDRILGR